LFGKYLGEGMSRRDMTKIMSLCFFSKGPF